MIKIVVDSGSTKSDWVVFANGSYSHCFQTLGLNPETISEQVFLERLNTANIQLAEYDFFELYFLGSGCGTQRARERVATLLKDKFKTKIFHLEVKEDTYAAIYATCLQGEPGIVCINGTGSNCTYFDGKEVFQAVESLGYLAMDDFSGTSLGRKIIRSYYFNTMPSELKDKMNGYNMTADYIKENFYKKENPNAFLGSHLPFLIENKSHLFFQQMIKEEIKIFVENYIMQYLNYKEVPIHFIGSTAFLLKEEVQTVLKEYNLIVGKFYQKPLEGLVEYFSQKKQ